MQEVSHAIPAPNPCGGTVRQDCPLFLRHIFKKKCSGAKLKKTDCHENYDGTAGAGLLVKALPWSTSVSWNKRQGGLPPHAASPFGGERGLPPMVH